MSVGKFLAGFIVGGTVGAVIGILLAPQSGEETRQMLSDKSSDLYKNTEESIKELKTHADVAMTDIQKKGDDILRKIQELLKQEQQSA